MLRSPLNLCAWLQTCILLVCHHQTLSQAVFTGSGVLFVPLLVAEHAFQNAFQCSGSASGLWSTDVSPTPAVTHSSPPFQTEDDFRPFVTHWLFSVPKSLSWTQPISFMPRCTPFFYVRGLLVCVIPPPQAFPVLTSSCH